MTDKLKIYAIQTKSGFYVSLNPVNAHSYGAINNLRDHMFDGVSPEATFHPDWRFVVAKPVKVSHMEKQQPTNHRFVLVDDSLVSPERPLELKHEEAGHYAECGEFVWEDKYALYRSLYVEVSDPQPDKEVEDEFEWIPIMSVDGLSTPPKLSYPIGEVHIPYTVNKVMRYIENSSIKHQELDRIVFPSLLIHETRAQLSAKDSYDIIREYVRTHVDPKVAQVTTDYDSHFEVKKRILLVKPYEHKYTPFTWGRKNPKVQIQWVADKWVPCFVLESNSNDKSKLPPTFEGDNEADLKMQIDAYLEVLMSMINEPLKECPHCGGTGIVQVEKAEVKS